MCVTNERAPVAIKTKFRPPRARVPCRAKHAPSGRQFCSDFGGKAAQRLPGILSAADHSLLAFFATSILKMPASSSSGVDVACVSEPKQTAIQHAITILNAIVRTFPSAILR
jgi:hypothetical protein